LKVKQKSGKLGTVEQSKTYCPAQFFSAPSSLLINSATVVGQIRSEDPVSIALDKKIKSVTAKQ
jgi:hypothetical protein